MDRPLNRYEREALRSYEYVRYEKPEFQHPTQTAFYKPGAFGPKSIKRLADLGLLEGNRDSGYRITSAGLRAIGI